MKSDLFYIYSEDISYDIYADWSAGGTPLDAVTFIDYDIIHKDLTEEPTLESVKKTK